MNQRIRHLTVALIVLFAVLFVQLTTWLKDGSALRIVVSLKIR